MWAAFGRTGSIFKMLTSRTLASLATPPTLRTSALAAIVAGGLAGILLPYGLKSGFLKPEPVKKPALWAKIIPMTFVFPGVVEEWLFRVLLLPNPATDAAVMYRPIPLTIQILLSMSLFLVYHLSPIHRPKSLFRDQRFMVMAGVLGAGCTVVYLASGSIWLPAIVHWLAVATWWLGFGGINKLGRFQ